MQTALNYRTNRDLFSNYYLKEHLPETEAWDEVPQNELQEAFDDIKDLWDREKSTAPKRNESQLEEKFIRPMFRKLGIPFEVEESTNRTKRRPDYGFFSSEDAARDAFERRDSGDDFYKNSVAVADAKRWGRPLDTRGSGEHKRDFENPSYQIHVYLQETPTQWAVLTNGQKWRLYYGPTSHRLDSYYEIDLPAVLEEGDLEDFKYFYLFFRHGAFLEDAGGDCFLDDVYGQSNVFAQELGDDLQDNIYEAIKILSEGFLQYPDNDLDDGDLGLIHDSSLIYLYRLIFVLYAEAEGRELLDTSNEIYEQSYSLNSLKQEVAEELDSSNPKYHDWQDDLNSRLDELFTLIDQGSKSRGIPEEDLYVPAYNGGLFRTDPDEDDDPEARFLAEHTVGDAYLARVVELLTRSQNEDGKIFVDYSSLDVRHLGSIYEGLLEYQIHVADEPLALDDGEYVSASEDGDIIVEEGEVYLTTGSGERKATGSYYTPEYVVEYIVDETLGPLVDNIREDLVGQSAFDEGGFAEEFAERVFDLKVLDPAMGSGHFLTSAVDYLAREIIDAQERQAEQQGVETIDKERDINWARRKVAQRCIYGVDLNPLATELAKVSLWLRTLAAEQPLAFLDHHLKTGNSLVGSDIEDVLSNGDNDDVANESGQLTLQQSFDRTRQQAIEHVMDRFQDLLSIDNETLEDAKEMEDVYDEVRDDPLYQHLLSMANVHTAEAFDIDVPSDAYERMASALKSDSWADVEDQEWFKTAQTIANDECFFHWELEFPVAFYNSDGNRKPEAGFDTVIGNPPWVNAWEMTDDDGDIRRVIEDLSDVDNILESHWDLYVAFLLKAYSTTKPQGRFSFIVPNAVSREKYAKPLRKFLLEETKIENIISFGEENVFEGVSRQTIVPVFSKEIPEKDKHKVHIVNPAEVIPSSITKELTGSNKYILQERFHKNVGHQIRHEMNEAEYRVLEKMDRSPSLGNICYVNYGAQVSSKKSGEFGKDDVVSEGKREGWTKFFEGNDLSRYRIEWDNLYLDYRPNDMYGPRAPELFESNKLVFRKVSGNNDSIIAAYDDENLYCDDGLVLATHYENIDGSGLHEQFAGYNRSNEDYDLQGLLAIVASSIETFYYKMRLATGSLQGGYSHVYPQHVRKLPIPSIEFTTSKSERDQEVSGLLDEYERYLHDSEHPPSPSSKEIAHDFLAQLAAQIATFKKSLASSNLNFLDYLGNYTKGLGLPDVGFFQPTGQNILDSTTENYEKLQVEQVRTRRDGPTVTIEATARYKPEDEDEHETDTYGYTESDFFEAFTLTDLSDKEATLVEAFVPVAVEDEIGGFRDNATKNISLLDRLKGITLPDIDDTADDLQRYIETKERADELREKIEKTDQLIDKIVYDLYDLTDEEIEIVESTVQND